MSFLSVLGGIGKTVAKVGLGAVGGVTGVNLNGMIFKDGQPSSVTSSVVAAPNPVVSPTSSNSLMDSIKGLFNAGTNFLTGQTHAQVDVNTGVGGRQGDATSTSSGLPSWLLPAALAGGGILLVSSLSKNKSRY